MMMGHPGFGNFANSSQGQQQQPQATVAAPNPPQPVPPPPNPPSAPLVNTSQPPALVARPVDTSSASESVGTPAGSSTPQRYPPPHFSPISPPQRGDRSKCSTVVMGDLSIVTSSDGSVYSYKEKDMTQSSLLGTSKTGSGINEPGFQVPTMQKISANVTQSDLDKVNTDANNNNKDTVQNSVDNLATDTSSVQEKVLPTFPANRERQPPLSNNRRITLAYKYYPFQKKVVKNTKPVSEARASDDDDPAPAKPEDASESSFPVDSFITKSWQYRDLRFRESLKKGLTMSDQQQEKPTPKEGENPDEDEEEDEDGFTLYSSNFASILKNKPEKKQSDFHYNKAKFATFVELESDINKLRRDDTKDWEIRMKLTAPEIKNIQTAMAHSLMAQSHAFAYIKASKAALNEVLLTLNPEEHGVNIQKIRDIKQLLSGVVISSEQSVYDAVYVHAGMTAQIRNDFLKAQGNYLPLHTKQALLHESLGGNALFDHQISKYEAEIAAHNAKIHQSKLDSAVSRSLDGGYKIPRRTDSTSGSHSFNHSGGLDNRSRGQKKFQDNFYDNSDSGKNKNKGRNNQQPKGNQQHQNKTRGGGGGGGNRGGRGGRGKKSKN